MMETSTIKAYTPSYSATSLESMLHRHKVVISIENSIHGYQWLLFDAHLNF